MKKMISMIIVVSMVLSTTVLAFNNEVYIEARILDDIQIQPIVGGNIYLKSNPDQTITIATNEDDGLVEFNMITKDEPDIIYRLCFTDIDNKTFDLPNDKFWNYIIMKSQDELEFAEKIFFSTEKVIFEEPIDVNISKSSVGADLMSSLKDKHGYMYSNKLKYTTNYSGETIRIYENMNFYIKNDGYVRWSIGEDTMSLLSFITGIIGLGLSSTALASFGIIFGVIPEISSIISGSGKLDTYRCSVYTSRYSTINSSEYAYGMTSHIESYNGYDDTDIYSETRATIVSDTYESSYTDSRNYYNSYSSQVRDGYELFLEIGQRP